MLRSLIRFVLVAAVCSDVSAALINVNETSDEFGSGSGCSLREAVQAANSDAAFGGCIAGSGTDVIMIAPSANDYYVGGSTGEDANATGDLDVTTSIIVMVPAPPAGSLTSQLVRVTCSDRCFHARGSASLVVLDMTLQGGDPGNANGGLVLQEGSSALNLARVVLRDGAAEFGGALATISTGDVTLTNVSIVGNTARQSGGGWYHSGSAEADTVNLTVSSNHALNHGGGIYANGPVRFRNATVARNTAEGTYGGFYFGSSSTAGVNLANSVFADNDGGVLGASSGDDFACFAGPLGARAFSLIESLSCSFMSSSGSALSADPKLTPLFDYGDALPTHAFAIGSPLSHAGNTSSANTLTACTGGDIRGVTRTATACDIGAFERAYTFQVQTTADLADATPGNGVCAASNGFCTLRAAFQEATASGGTVLVRIPAGHYFVAAPQPDEAALSLHPTIPTALTLLGDVDLPESVTIDANLTGRAIEVVQDAPTIDFLPALSLIGVTVTGAQAVFDSSATMEAAAGGAIRIQTANFLGYRDIIRDNVVSGGPSHGGALGYYDYFSANRPVVHLADSAILDNDALSPSTFGKRGGGLSFRGFGQPRVEINASTIAGNTSAGYGGGIYTNSQGTVRVVFSTLTGNQASIGGGGIDGAVAFGNSVIAGNVVLAPPGTNPGADCGGTGTESLGYNLIGTTLDCVRTGDLSTDLTNVSAQLSPRIAGFGPVPAYHPLAGSPLIGAVPASRCTDYVTGLRPVTDGHGDARPETTGGTCTIGVVEQIWSDQLFGDGFE